MLMLAQVWKNCRSFNAEGSDIAVACTGVAKWVRRQWSQLGLPKKEKPMSQGPAGPDSQLHPGPSSWPNEAAAANEAAEASALAGDAAQTAALGVRKRKRRSVEDLGDGESGAGVRRNKKVTSAKMLT